MFRSFNPPTESQFDTEEEYLEELEAYDAEMNLREEYAVERWLESR